MSDLPAFYVTRTLLGFDPREPDLNRITLNMPGDNIFVLCEMNEPRADMHIKRWNQLAKELTILWEKHL